MKSRSGLTSASERLWKGHLDVKVHALGVQAQGFISFSALAEEGLRTALTPCHGVTHHEVMVPTQNPSQSLDFFIQ